MATTEDQSLDPVTTDAREVSQTDTDGNLPAGEPARASIELRDAVLRYPLGPYRRGSIKAGAMRLLGHREPMPHLKYVEALHGINLTISDRERVGIIGHNGSGKSSLLRTLAGIYPLYSGDAIVRGRVGTLLEIGLGFETESTGRENIFYRGLAIGMSPSEIRAMEDDIIAFADLGEFIDLPMRTYSSGMYVRLGFAISTQITPDVLLIDEVFGAGDASFRERAERRMQSIVDSAGIVVMASHDMGLVERVCDRVLHIDNGKIVNDGAPADVVPGFLEDMHQRGNA